MQKITDIIPLIEEGKTIKEIAKHFNKSIPTINVYIRRLKDAGYTFKIKIGRPSIPLN